MTPLNRLAHGLNSSFENSRSVSFFLDSRFIHLISEREEHHRYLMDKVASKLILHVFIIHLIQRLIYLNNNKIIYPLLTLIIFSNIKKLYFVPLFWSNPLNIPVNIGRQLKLSMLCLTKS